MRAHAVCSLAEFLGHDDAAAVTPADVLAYKEHRVEQGRSMKTVSGSDIAGLRSVFQWAVDNRKLAANQRWASGCSKSKPEQTRSKSLTAEEAKAILSHAFHHQQGREGDKVFAAKRWVPWLCAYTGARVGELVQLRKQDVEAGGHRWAERRFLGHHDHA